MPDQYEKLRIARDSFRDLALDNAQAADRLAAEVERLKADRIRLEAENERLRRALLPFTAEQLIGLVLMPDEGRLGSDPPARPAYVHHRPLFDAARAALAQPQPQEQRP